MFWGRGTACREGGGKEKGDLLGQGMAGEREVCRGLSMGEGRMLDFILASMGNH